MPSTELLNNIDHKELKVRAEYSADLGDDIASTLTFITEFPEVQKEYPILFRKEPNAGNYQAIVLFGFQKGENLFLGEGGTGWNASYIPAAVARGPFLIGVQTQQENGQELKVPMVHVDMTHPKISAEVGIPVFREKGGNSEYLDAISDTLNLIRDGMTSNVSMIEAFEKYELIESVSIDIELKNEEKYSLPGFFTINPEKLSELKGEALEHLAKQGFLKAA